MATLKPSRLRRELARGLLLGSALVAACGDGIVDRNFRGVSFWSYDTVTEEGASLPENPGTLRLALFFAPSGIDELDVEKLVELPGSTTTVIPGAPVRMDVFELPTKEMFAHSKTGQLLDFAVARMIAYQDITGDGLRQKGEYFIGINGPYAFFYTPTQLAAEQSPTGRVLPAGFSSVLLPQTCGQRLPPPTDPGTCGVDIGNSCRTSDDCNGSTCLRETQLGWPAGYCTITEPVPSGGCRPGKAEMMFSPEYSPTPFNIQGYYLRRCATDEDCLRTADQNRYLYGCDVGLSACVPRRGGAISIFGPVEVAKICGKSPF